MPTTARLTPPTLPLLDSPAPKKTSNHITDHAFTPSKSCPCESGLLRLSQTPSTTPSVRLQLQPSANYDANPDSTMPQSREVEDEHTLSAYGDISLSEVIVSPLPLPLSSRPDSDVFQPKHPQPRLRLKVRRPPMPKRRMSYTYVPDTLSYIGGVDPDERWPGSPRPFKNSPTWHQHQPLVSPLESPRGVGNKPMKNDTSSLERLADELLLRSPSIRLSPPGSPASKALSLPQETHSHSGVQQGGKQPKRDDAVAKPPQTPPAPVRPQEKPWRTRLPPRLPIPKWDM